MSAEVLRRVASLMRERAEAATRGADWSGGHYWIVDYDPSDPTGQTAMQVEIGGMSEEGDAEHFASWHPVVALAVADWLDRVVNLYPHEPEDPRFPGSETARALAVARAYLGEDS